jgi:O-antigen/teichoic acid export membrane protein
MYLNNTLWLIADRVLRLSILLLVTVYLARYLGPEVYGQLSYILSFVGLFSAAASLGIDGIVIRELVAKPDKQAELLGTAFTIKIIGALLVSLTVFVSSYWFGNPQQTIKLMLVVSSSLFLDAFNVIDLNFQAKVKSVYSSLARMGHVLSTSALKIFMIYLEAPLSTFVYLILLDAIILSLTYVAANIRFGESIVKWRWNSSIGKQLFTKIRYLVIADIVISIYLKIDKVMIKELLDENALGVYAAACTLSEAWYFVPMAICSSLYPMLIDAKQQSLELYRVRLQQLYNLMVWISLAIIIPVTFLAEPIMQLLYGSAYLAGAPVLSIHIWASLFVFLGVASGKWLLLESKFSVISGRAAAGLAFNVGLNLVFIPKFGLIGAALATLLSQSINGLFYDLYDRGSRSTFRMKVRALLLIDRSMFKLKNSEFR